MDSFSEHGALTARLRSAGCVFAEEEAALLAEAGSAGADLEALVRRRIAGEPLEHVLGWVDFDGARLHVGPGAFVPRQRTRLLARLASALVRAQPEGAVRLLEVCCGVAPVAATIARDHPGCDVLAVDIDPRATAYAALNLGSHRVRTGDLFEPVPREWRGRVDVCVANAPYVPSGEVVLMPAEARDHEPLHTLAGGADGLDLHRRIAAEVSRWLAPGGVVLVEVSTAQAAHAQEVFAAAGLGVRTERDEDLDATVVVATWPGVRTPPRLGP